MKGSFWLWLFILIILVAGVWYFGLFQKTRDFFISFEKKPVMSQIEGSSKKLFSDLKKDTVSSAGEISLENLFRKTVSIPQKIFSEIAKKATDSAVESVKQQANEAFDSLGQKIGLKPSGQINELPLTVTLDFPKNSPVSFTISGLESDTDYSIDWSDGEKLSGQISSQGKKTIEHKWTKSGSYLITAELKSKNGDVRKSSFPILISE